MSMKPKTVRRLLLLGAVAAIVVLGGTASVLLRQHQNERTTLRLRTEGFAAFEREDFPAVIELLGRYLHRTPKDSQALLRFARSCARRETANGKHLTDALSAFKQYLALVPEDKAILRETLDLHLEAGLLQEAVFYSQKLRPTLLADATAADLPVLRIEAAAMLGMRPHDVAAPDVLRRICTVASSNFSGSTSTPWRAQARRYPSA